MDFFISFLSVSVGGALLSALLPAGGTGKSVKVLISFTICLSLIFLAADTISNREIQLPDFSLAVGEEISEDAERLTAMGIESALAGKTSDLVESYTGNRPAAVDCSVCYSDGTFLLEKIKIYMPCRDKATVFARLASELGIDYQLIELCEVS